jgi:hypothetical protein
MQPDTDTRSHQVQSAEPGNFETARRGRGWNPDAPTTPEPGSVDYEEINTHGSER